MNNVVAGTSAEQNLDGITLLGNQKTKYAYDYDPGQLERFERKFENTCPDEQIVSLDCFEFASRCVAGDTYIYVANDESKDFRDVKIKDLVGTEGFVRTVNPSTLESDIKRYHDVRMTRHDVSVVKVSYNYTWTSSKEGYSSHIVCTPEHMFLVKKESTDSRWIAAEDLKSGMQLVTDPNDEDAVASVVSVEPAGTADVYNMEVDDTECYFANDVVIHNCPKTGQPDFATIHISYIPNKWMVESKSLKLYLFSFQQHGDFHESCIHMIMQDLVDLLHPKYLEVYGDFNSRGGISILPFSVYADEEHMSLKATRQAAMMQYNISHRPRTAG